jgi:hypothetical protein
MHTILQSLHSRITKLELAGHAQHTHKIAQNGLLSLPPLAYAKE